MESPLLPHRALRVQFSDNLPRFRSCGRRRRHDCIRVSRPARSDHRAGDEPQLCDDAVLGGDKQGDVVGRGQTAGTRGATHEWIFPVTDRAGRAWRTLQMNPSVGRVATIQVIPDRDADNRLRRLRPTKEPRLQGASSRLRVVATQFAC
jgi:hypothetical protein